MKEEKIEIDAVLVYRDGKVYVERMVTGAMDCYLFGDLMQAMNDAIVAYYNAKKGRRKEYVEGTNGSEDGE